MIVEKFLTKNSVELLCDSIKEATYDTRTILLEKEICEIIANGPYG